MNCHFSFPDTSVTPQARARLLKPYALKVTDTKIEREDGDPKWTKIIPTPHIQMLSCIIMQSIQLHD